MTSDEVAVFEAARTRRGVARVPSRQRSKRLPRFSVMVIRQSVHFRSNMEVSRQWSSHRSGVGSVISKGKTRQSSLVFFFLLLFFFKSSIIWVKFTYAGAKTFLFGVSLFLRCYSCGNAESGSAPVGRQIHLEATDERIGRLACGISMQRNNQEVSRKPYK